MSPMSPKNPGDETPPDARRAFQLPSDPRRLRDEADAELRFHLEGRVEDLMARGMSRQQAEAEVRRRFGDVERYGAELASIDGATHRRRERGEWLQAIGRDLRYGFRALRRKPAFSAIVVLTLALGIGANTAIFSFVNAVLLHPLPVSNLERYYVIRDDFPAVEGLRNIEVSPAEAIDLGKRTDIFDGVTAYNGGSYNLEGTGDPQRIAVTRTLGPYWGLFGVRPQLGRLYRPEESENGGNAVVVLSDAAWQQIFGGDRGVIGRTIQLSGRGYQVIGVLPPEFRFPRTAQMWTPFPIDTGWTGANRRGTLIMSAVARARPGLTRAQVESALQGEARRWMERYAPDEPKFSHTLVTVPFVEWQAGALSRVLVVLMGAVVLVLLIACANVASLQLVRSAERGKEIAVRAALGASRWAVARHLLAESLVMALCGGALGLALGAALVRVLSRWNPSEMRAISDVRLDAPVFLFAAGATLLAAVLFGTFPALRAARVDLQDALKESSRGASAGVAKSRFLQGSVVVQLALTLVLLLGSGLMIKSLARLLDTDPGFRSEHVETMALSLPGARYQGLAPKLAFHDALMARLEAMPGIEAAGNILGLPFSDMDNSSPFDIIGRPKAEGGPERHARMYFVGGDYFQAMGVPLKRGRLFSGADVEKSGDVAIIDERLAREFFPNQDPIGQRISQGWESTIVGVVGAVKKSDLAEKGEATIYYPYRQKPWALGTMNVVVRSTLPEPSVAGLLRSAVKDVDAQLPVYDVMSMGQRVERSLGARRLAMAVLTGFAALSLVLALLGVYGVISYSMSQRTHEIGIRMALGARPQDVTRMVLGSGLLLAMVGLVSGLLLFLGLGRVLAALNEHSALIYGVGVRDPATVAVGLGILVAVALLASWLPARRAARTDPIAALRVE